MTDNDETRPETPKFDFAAYPEDTLFYDRRSGLERRAAAAARAEAEAKVLAEAAAAAAAATADPAPPARRVKKERRRRIDPTTFEKQYTNDEMEFMTAMQWFKTRTGKAFPSFSEVISVAVSLGYRQSQLVEDDEEFSGEESPSREVEPACPG